MITLPELRAALGGHIVAGQLVCPGPGHSHRDRSMAVRPSDTARYGFVVTSYAGDDWRDCIDYVCERAGIDTAEPYREPSAFERLVAKGRRDEAERIEAEHQARRIAKATRIWGEAVDPRDTLVERYLRGRALDLPADIAGSALRFHPACPWESSTRPAMVAAMTNVATGELRAIHRTALTGAGEKIGRKMLGPAGGTAIMFDAAGDALCVGEGIESVLSGRQLGYRPAWAMASVGGIERLPVLPGVERLTILQENDENGASPRAVLACGQRWQAANRTVFTIRPPAGCSDLNDMLRSRA